MKKVSVLVRTCGRTAVLERCLKSIQRQSYSNIETIVVEDGPEQSKELIDSKFSGMDIYYFCTGKRMGRAAAGNLAMQLAGGDYFNFLDDDDEFYPDHVEKLVKALEGTDCKAAYALAREVSCIARGKGKYLDLFRKVRFRQEFNRLYLLITNYFPIQTVMFERSLFETLGGFRKELDYLEDWDLWVRYASKTSFYQVKEVTSFYRVPLFSLKRDFGLRMARKQAAAFFSEYRLEEEEGRLFTEVNQLIRDHYESGLKRKIFQIGSRLLKIYRNKSEKH